MAQTHHERVCPVWVGHLLASPIRKLFQNPAKILTPYVAPGMRVLEIGPGLGFFSLAMAKLVGPSGRVICVDIQNGMITALTRRARRAGLGDRIEARLSDAESLRIDDLAHQIDFVLAFYVVHETGDKKRLFSELREAMKPGSRILLSEPLHHVSREAFEETVAVAEQSGLRRRESLKIRGSQSVLLELAPESAAQPSVEPTLALAT